MKVLTIHGKNIQNLIDKLNIEIEKYAKASKIDVVYIYENLRPALAYIEVKKILQLKLSKE